MKNRNIQFKPTLGLLIVLLLTCFALPRRTQAVVPAPDGGYPGFNTAEGQNALFDLTTGTANTAVGWHALSNNLVGSSNTATGMGALRANTADKNTAFGAATLFNNTTGHQNTAVGATALFNNTTGSNNTANGAGALYSNTAGNFNTANGVTALYSNTTGHYNTANGGGALANNTSGRWNTATGLNALFGNSTGSNNMATGVEALSRNHTGNFNTAVGNNALISNTTGSNNTANGAGALYHNTAGNFNTANGLRALSSNTTGGGNVALGVDAGSSLTIGTGNVCIGTDVSGVAGEGHTTRIRNIGSTPIVGGNTVVISGTGGIGDGKLGYASSSRRYKQEIKPMEDASESLLALKPVTFRAKGATDDTTRVKHYGLIAEEVATVNPDLVVFNPEGQPETLRFDSINAMLLNEFLKEHRKNEEQEAIIAQLKSGMEALAAIVKKQAAQIQKVSAHLEVGRSAPQTVLNNQ